MNSLYLMLVLVLGAEPCAADKFSDVQIEKPFDRYLLANPLLMETTGAKIIRLPKKKIVVLAVASTVLKGDSAPARLRAERICRTKALACLVQEQTGVAVFHTEESTDETVIVNVDGKERGTSISRFLEVTQSKVEGIAKDMPVIGRWKSKDGDVLYLAIGALLDKQGELVPSSAKDYDKE